MSYGGGGFMSGSQTTPGEGKQAGPTSLRPVTIAQVLSARQDHADAEYFIDGVETKDISLVACVRNYSKASTNTTMQVEDGTGQIDARKWDQTGDEDVVEVPVEVNTYVRIMGTIKTFGGKRHIACNTIRPISDKNEIMYHAIETVYVHLYALNNGPPTGAGGQNNNNNNNTNVDRKPNVPSTNNTEAYSDLDLIQRKIMQYFASLDPAPDEGLHSNAIHQRACPGISLEKCLAEIANLSESGYIYQTIDDDHFATAA